MSETQFFAKVTDFLARRDPEVRLDGIDEHSDLIRAGVLDSLSITDLILFLEDQTGRSIPLAELSIDSIKSVSRLYDTYVRGQSS